MDMPVGRPGISRFVGWGLPGNMPIQFHVANVLWRERLHFPDHVYFFTDKIDNNENNVHDCKFSSNEICIVTDKIGKRIISLAKQMIFFELIIVTQCNLFNSLIGDSPGLSVRLFVARQ